MKKNGMCGAYSMYVEDMRCLVLGWGSLYDRDYLDDPGIDGDNITMDLQEVECGEPLDQLNTSYGRLLSRLVNLLVG